MSRGTVLPAAWPADPRSGGVRVLFAGGLAEAFGAERIVPVPPDGCSADEVRDLLCGLVPKGAAALRHPAVQIQVGDRDASGHTRVLPGQRVSFRPD